MTQPTQPDGNNLAIASLILGILSIAGMSILTGIPAIITGVLGLKNPVNKGMSIAGIIMGSISVLLALLVLLFIVVLLIVGGFAASSYESNPEYYQDPMESSESNPFQQRA